MAEITNKEFIILTKSKDLIFYIDDILENVPRKDMYYKDRIRDCCLQIIYNIIFINNSKIIDNTCFSNILTNISLIDLYLERLVKKNYISLSTSNKIAVKLTEINKMCNTWRKNNEES